MKFGSSWEFAKRGRDASRLLLCPPCHHGSAGVRERTCKALLGEDGRKRNLFSWYKDARVTEPSHVL